MFREATIDALGLSQDNLAASARVSTSTLRDFEARRRIPIANNLMAIQAVPEKAGIEFVSNEQGSASGILSRPQKEQS